MSCRDQEKAGSHDDRQEVRQRATLNLGVQASAGYGTTVLLALSTALGHFCRKTGCQASVTQPREIHSDWLQWLQTD